MSANYVVHREQSGLFRFHLQTENGEQILFSETYKEKRSAFVGITSIKKNSQDANRYVKKTAVDGRFYFLLKAANHEAIGRSSFFATAQERDEVMDRVMVRAPYGELKDTTRQYRKRKVA